MIYLRQQLSQGHRLPECDRCWKKESHGRKSTRIITNDSMTDNQWSQGGLTWFDSYFKNKSDYTADILVAADIKTSNLCNFACVMCVPEDSSQLYNLWQKHQDRSHVLRWQSGHRDNVWQDIKSVFQLRDNMDLLDWIMQQTSLRHLKILGGEPLIDQRLMSALAALPDHRKKHISVSIVTNGSQSLASAAKKLQGFKHLQFTVSLDGIGQYQEYVRRNSVWQQIETNILDFLRYDLDRTSMTAHHVLQAFSWWSLPDLVTWCDRQSVPLTMTHIDEPAYLSIKSLPQPLLDQISERFDFPLPDMIDQDSTAAEVLQDSTDTNAMQQFYHYLDWLDSTGHTPWAKIFPELAALDPRSVDQN